MGHRKRPSGVVPAKRRRPPEVPESIREHGRLYYYDYGGRQKRLQNRGDWMKQKGLIDRYRTREYDRMTVGWDEHDRPVHRSGYALFVR